VSKTFTPRMGQPQWSSGSDSFRRADMNSAGANDEARSAYDDGQDYATLPGTVIAGRYVMRQPAASAFRSLYRSTGDGGSWEFALGNAVPAPLSFRPHLAGDQAVTAAAATFTHPSLSNAGATVSYSGVGRFSGLTSFDLNDSDGSVHVGVNTAFDPANLGRLHVRTRVDGDRGIVLRAHGLGASSIFSAQEPGGQDVITVDASGYLRARALSAFGGGAVSTGAAVVVAPTSASGDGVNVGLLTYGQSSAPAKTIFSALRDAGDTAPILNVSRDALSIGRLDWGSGTSGGVVSISGRQLVHRAVGFDADSTLWKLSRADSAAPGNTANDDLLLSYTRSLGQLRTPMIMTQALSQSGINLQLKRYVDFTSRFMQLDRVTGSEVLETLGTWEADGRITAGARWLGTGVRRDARQSILHQASHIFDVDVNPGDTLTYAWPTMTARSSGVTDLAIQVRVEATLGPGAFSDREDGQVFPLSVDISVNGGSYAFIGTVNMGGPAHRSGARPVIVETGSFEYLNLPANATFTLQTRMTPGAFAVPVVSFHAMFVYVNEQIVTQYSTL
jgi:hypothetical protein